MNNEKIKTKINAKITHSNTKRYTVSVKVTRKDNNKPVEKGKVVITAKKGRVIGKAELDENGEAEITSAITKKDYKLKVVYEGTAHTYDESKTKINFKKQYMFYKTSSYLWVCLLIALIAILYTIFLNEFLLDSTLMIVNTIAPNVAYIDPESCVMLSSIFKNNMHYIGTIFNILVWILIISFIIAGVYAKEVKNPNYHNIIRKNVTNHDMFKNFLPIVVLVLVIITVVEVILTYII